ncbi:LuxR family transcriptional regulator [Chloroflexales bacterium ZM16-3]|nr:LuxR family transcriptional regulator [Chloroflexales bacterium ZM16-3]
MPTLVIATKLFIPPPRPDAVPRPALVVRLNAGLHRKLTLLAAPAGFGKTSLASAWLADCGRPAAWLSLDEGDADPARFLTYLIAALQTLSPTIGADVLALLQSSQPPSIDALLPLLLNQIATLPRPAILVLEDYHLLDSRPIDQALGVLVEHLPAQLHLVIATREDPPLPLARLRARDQLSELRASDLRFTPDEAAMFLNQVMGLDLAAEHVAALEARTEGWIAGLQLAALSLREREDVPGFIRAFAGDNRYILDYLAEEVVQRQPDHIQRFLLQTSVLDRLCGPLCDAILDAPAASGQAILAYLEQANLFLVPLDNERRWYRYHQLFVEVLRQRLHQRGATDPGEALRDVAGLHQRASVWYEAQGLKLEAFQHAAAANDLARAERLIEGSGVPLHFRGAGAPIRRWLEALPRAALNERPSLWVTYASTLLFGGQPTAVEPKLQAAEAALQAADPDERTRDLVGRIASMRATLAVMQHNAAAIIAQSRRALEYLHANNLPFRTATTWTLGYAYQLEGDRGAAGRAFRDVIAAGSSSGASIYTIAATINLGQLQEADNQLSLAAESYRRVLQLAGDPPAPIACEAYLGLARIAYQLDDLAATQQYGQQCLQLTRRIERVDTSASYALLLARLHLAQGDLDGAAAVLDGAEAFVRQHGFAFRMPEIVAAQVLVLLRQGHLATAAQLAATHELSLSQARVHLAQGEPTTALVLLEPLRHRAEAQGWADAHLAVLVLQAVALRSGGEMDKAQRVLAEALALVKPEGFIRTFVDEGAPMADLLAEALAAGVEPTYVRRLLAAFPLAEPAQTDPSPASDPDGRLVEPLSERECEVLALIAEGLTNQDIAARLYLSLHTVKVHARNIYAKLRVTSRTQAVARGRALGILAQT